MSELQHKGISAAEVAHGLEVQGSGASHKPLIRTYMPELDSVRGIAVLMVMCFHGMAPPASLALSAWGRMLFGVVQFGWTGVNLFFVLSGFLISGILLDSKNRPDYFSRFYYRRVLRILPALYTTLAFLWAARFISWQFVVLSAAFLANSGNFFGVVLQYGPLWSLAVEEHFYLLWPSMVRKFETRTLIIISGTIWLGTPVVRIVCWLAGSSPHGLQVLHTWFNLDGLALGSLLAIWLRHATFSRVRLLLLAPMAVILGIAGFVMASHYSFTAATLSVSLCNLAAAGVLASALMVGTTRWRFLVDQKVLKFFGFISYGLYLVHVLAFHLAEDILAPWWIRVIATAGPTAAMLLRFVVGASLGIAVAYLSRRSLEETFLRLRLPRRAAPSSVAARPLGAN